MNHFSKKMGLLVAVAIVFALAASFTIFSQKAEAAATITVGTSTIISSSTIRVDLNGSSTLNNVTSSAWHVDINTGGTTPLTATSATIVSSTTPWRVNLTFAGNPFTTTSISYDASHGLYVDASGVSDTSADSNYVYGHTSSTAILDGQAPTVSTSKITGANQITVVFSESVSSTYTAPYFTDLKILGEARSLTTSTGNGTATIVLTFNGGAATSSATGTIDMVASTTDLIGNALTALNDQTLTDGQAATLTAVTIASDNTSTTWAKVGDTVTITITASEGITSVSSTIATASTTIASSSATAWTVTRMSQTGDTESAIAFTIDFSDLVSNVGTQVVATTNSSAVTFDQTRATTTITSSATSPTTSAPIPVTITFGEPVTGFVLADITITGGDSPALTTVSSTEYSIPVFPTMTDGTVTVAVASSVATDRAGNVNGTATTFTITYNGGGSSGTGGVGGGGGGGSGTITPAFVPSTQIPPGQLNVAEIMVRIAELQAQIAAMQGTGEVGVTVRTIARNLTSGVTGADVKALQQYLNANGFPVAASGPGSPGNETMRFGGLTRAALAKWQTSVGLPGTGYFGPMTRAYLQSH